MSPDNRKPLGLEPEPRSAGEWGIIAAVAFVVIAAAGSLVWWWLA